MSAGANPTDDGPEPRRGTYALILRSESTRRVRIGRLGNMTLYPGFFVYVGGAFGPGGLRARVGHHLKKAHRPRWHVDFLRRHTRPVEVWYTYDPTRREHQWAQALTTLRGASVPLPGFGSSDCRCCAHLFRFAVRPGLRTFVKRIRSTCDGHGEVASIVIAHRQT